MILGRHRAAGFSFYVLLLSIHTKEKGILSPKDLAINMKYWRSQKVRMSEEWLLLPMDDIFSHWDLICILEFQSLGKTLRDWIIVLVTLLVAVTLSCHDPPKGWTIYSFSHISFFTVGVKETRVLGVCGGHSSSLNKSEIKEIILHKNMACMSLGSPLMAHAYQLSSVY